MRRIDRSLAAVAIVGLTLQTPTQQRLYSATRPVSFGTLAAPTEGPHDYFDTLIARKDCWRAWSLRPTAGHSTAITSCGQSRYEKQLLGPSQGGYANTGSYPYSFTYCYTGTEPNCAEADSHPQKQDAAKMVIPMWDHGFGRVLGAPMEAVPRGTTSTIELADASLRMPQEFNSGVLVDKEIMLFTRRNSTSRTGTVVRGAFGTTPTAHAVGTPVRHNTNKTITQMFLPLNTDGTESADYLFVWDAYFTDSFIANRHGIQVHKGWHFNSAGGDDNWFRADPGYVPYAREDNQPRFNGDTMIGVARGRRLFSTIIPPSVVNEAHHPMLPFGRSGAAPVIYPNRWTRWWILIETKAEGVAANFSNVTTLNAPITDANATSMSIVCPVSSFGKNCPAFLSPASIAGAKWPGRSLRVGSEIMTITSGVSSGNTATLQVVRGAYNTTSVPHAGGATVQLVHDYITMWYADENTEPVQVYDRYPTHLDENDANPRNRGGLLRLRIEFDSSLGQIPEKRLRNGQEDLVMYTKNYVVLKNSLTDWVSLRIKPVR
jgi:hypothetical protein